MAPKVTKKTLTKSKSNNKINKQNKQNLFQSSIYIYIYMSIKKSSPKQKNLLFLGNFCEKTTFTRKNSIFTNSGPEINHRKPPHPINFPLSHPGCLIGIPII